MGSEVRVKRIRFAGTGTVHLRKGGRNQGGSDTEQITETRLRSVRLDTYTRISKQGRYLPWNEEDPGVGTSDVDRVLVVNT